MNKLGLLRVCAFSPVVKPGNVDFNLANIKNAISSGVEKGVDLIAFPELSITGYTCADLFYQPLLLNSAANALIDLSLFLKDKPVIVAVGVPLKYNDRLYNCAAVLYKGKILGVIPKTHLPNYNEFYEKRWFASALSLTESDTCIDINGECVPFGNNIVFNVNGVKFSAEICEDLWVPVPPSSRLSVGGADIVMNLSASNEQGGKHNYLIDLIKNQSARCRCAYVYSSAGWGESSTDLAFAGNCIIAENGTVLKESERFGYGEKCAVADVDVQIIQNDKMKFSSFSDDSESRNIRMVYADSSDFECTGKFEKEIYRLISPTPFTSGSEDSFRQRCEEISDIQAWGLAQRLNSIGCKTAVIGISGGLDSTLALLVTVKAFDNLNIDRRNIHAVTMPGFGTTGRTHANATELMELLGTAIHEINIGKAVELHFQDISHDSSLLDATYENSQARERTQILMDLANKLGGIVIGTGDLSELALGWCTYNGDQMSMYGVNASVPKTLVKFLVRGYAEQSCDENVKRVLYDIIDTPISPELLPADANGEIAQKTEDAVGPYLLHDFFIHSMLRHSMEPEKIYFLACKAFENKFTADEIKRWLRNFYHRFFNQQFKRSCMPDGVKVGSVCLSPRGDWRMPSDASAELWLKEVEKL